jgi:hypothetical protein
MVRGRLQWQSLEAFATPRRKIFTQASAADTAQVRS